MCSEYDIKGYPSLLFIRKGGMLAEHKGGRDYKDLSEFIDSQPPASPGGESEKVPLVSELVYFVSQYHS